MKPYLSKPRASAHTSARASSAGSSAAATRARRFALPGLALALAMGCSGGDEWADEWVDEDESSELSPLGATSAALTETRSLCGRSFRYDSTSRLDDELLRLRQAAGSTTHNAFVSRVRRDFGMRNFEPGTFGTRSDQSAMLNALWALDNAAPPGNGFGKINPLNTSYSFAASRVNTLQPVCRFDDVNVLNLTGVNPKCDSDDPEVDACNVPSVHVSIRGIETRHHVQFKRDSLFTKTAVGRAALLVHEARHSDQGTSALIDSHPGLAKNGPYAVQVKWLAWFAATANPIFSDDARRAAARSANALADQEDFNIPFVVAATRANGLKVVGFEGGLPIVDSPANAGRYPRAVLFQDGFSGRQGKLRTFGRHLTLGGIGNDQVSSVWVQDDHCLVLTEDGGFRGRRRVFEPGAHASFGSFNDEATNAAVYSKLGLPCARFETGELPSTNPTRSASTADILQTSFDGTFFFTRWSPVHYATEYTQFVIGESGSQRKSLFRKNAGAIDGQSLFQFYHRDDLCGALGRGSWRLSAQIWPGDFFQASDTSSPLSRTLQCN